MRILSLVSGGQKTVLHTQPIATSCSGAQFTLNTCVFAPACRRGAWLAWQQYSLLDAQGSQRYLALEKGRTYIAEFTFAASQSEQSMRSNA